MDSLGHPHPGTAGVTRACPSQHCRASARCPELAVLARQPSWRIPDTRNGSGSCPSLPAEGKLLGKQQHPAGQCIRGAPCPAKHREEGNPDLLVLPPQPGVLGKSHVKFRHKPGSCRGGRWLFQCPVSPSSPEPWRGSSEPPLNAVSPGHPSLPGQDAVGFRLFSLQIPVNELPKVLARWGVLSPQPQCRRAASSPPYSVYLALT